MFTLHAFTSIAILLLATSCLAGTIELKVAGRVVPSSCVVAFSDNGEVNFGLIQAGSLDKDSVTPLRARQLSMSIDCAQLTKVALKITDERASSMIAGLIGPGTSDQEAFGLGMSGPAKIGNYYVHMQRESLYVDDRRAELLYSVDGNKSWKRTGPAGELRRDRSFAWTLPETRLPLSLKTLRSTLSVTPYITKAGDLPVNREIDLDGQASVELQYF